PLALRPGLKTLKATLAGFDDEEVSLEVKAGEVGSVELQLLPNSRALLVQTSDEGVEVLLDGVVHGTTRFPDDPARQGGAAVAELLLTQVPLGEHRIEVRQPCHRTEEVRDLISAALDDRAPKVYGPFTLERLRAWLVPQGSPAGAELLVDGEHAATLPIDAIEVCPGSISVTARLRQRTLYADSLTLEAGERRELALEPRPNVLLVSHPGESVPDEPFFKMTNVRIVERPSSEPLEPSQVPEDTDLIVQR